MKLLPLLLTALALTSCEAKYNPDDAFEQMNDPRYQQTIAAQ